MSTTKRGRFVTFEGTDGSGKSTQLRLLGSKLRELGHDVVETAEPGGTPIGARIRSLLLDPANQDLEPMAELLLMFASRAQHIGQLIEPALERGAIVLCDRFTDSSIAYQGAGRGLGREVVNQLHSIACNNLKPDLTLVIDIDTATSLERTRSRNQSANVSESRFDEEAEDFHRRVRHAFLRIAAEEPARVRVIDGSGSPDEVAARVWGEITLPDSDSSTPPE